MGKIGETVSSSSISTALSIVCIKNGTKFLDYIAPVVVVKSPSTNRDYRKEYSLSTLDSSEKD